MVFGFRYYPKAMSTQAANGSAPVTTVGPSLTIRRTPLPRPSARAVGARLAEGARSAFVRIGPVTARLMRRRRRDDVAVATALRSVCNDLGGSFSKLGQLIGSAPSLFGDDVAAVFRSTLDDVAAVPFDEVRAIVEDELGLPLGRLFLTFDEGPIAAASLAVVHRARLIDGREVAVKVLRPGIEHKMAVDLAVMRPLFGLIGREIAIGLAGELPQLISGLEEQLEEELDLRNEARTVLWFEHLRTTMGLDRLTVPLPVDGHVAKRVLVMDFIEGVPIDDVGAIERRGVDIGPLVREWMEGWFATALCTGAFHGDVHAGNLLVTGDGRLGVLDWGIVGRLDPATQTFFRRMIEGVLGDESAWFDIWQHTTAIFGRGLQDQLGLGDDAMIQFVRGMIEPIFTRPFGDVDLRAMLTAGDPAAWSGAPEGRGSAKPTIDLAFWRSERRRRRSLRESGADATPFSRGMFLLGKQLIYLDRYGKLFLSDIPLLWDRAAFERLLAEPVAVTLADRRGSVA
jgi:predicted unusual protein kinase regulating ubiquinone biosynthesis (AarF/ABC1/UbiB family)